MFSSVYKHDPIYELTLLANINKLPIELKDFVSSFIPTKVKMFLNRDLYLENHKFIKDYINTIKFDTYIRDIIRKDHSFVFQNLLVHNIEKWIKWRHYLFRDCVYLNFLIFLNFCQNIFKYPCQNFNKVLFNYFIINSHHAAS